ncbi:MAG: Efflux pump periplasmic linker BepF [bacterium]|nr:Efflux pump periplasmic linker BepF [bacterium]
MMPIRLSHHGRVRFLSVSALAILGILTAGCQEEKTPATTGGSPSGPAPAVVVAEVTRQTVPLVREFTGRIDASASVDLRARVEGILEEQLFEEGKLVKKGQVLFGIDRLPFEATLESVKAKHQKALADLAYAQQQVSVRAAEAELLQAQARNVREQKELERTQALVKQGVQTPQDLDTAVARAEAASAEVETRRAQLTNAKLTEDANIKQASAAVVMAKADITQAELNLGYCTISAPFDGLIGLSQVDVGNLVGRGEPTLLATVSALDPIRVHTAVSESDYLQLARRRGAAQASPEFEMALGDGSLFPHKGKFLMAERAVDLKTGTLSVVAEFPNPGNFLRPGLFCRVRVAIDRVENAVLVPQRAVFEQQSAKVVYVVGPDNKVAFRTVVVGERHEDLYIVTEGLQPGEKVIVEGQLKVRPGAVVTPSDKPITQEKPSGAAAGH